MKTSVGSFKTFVILTFVSIFPWNSGATRPSDQRITATDPGTFRSLLEGVSALTEGRVPKGRALDQIRQAMTSPALKKAGVPDPLSLDEQALMRWVKSVKLAKVNGEGQRCTLSYDTASGVPVKINIERGAVNSSEIDFLLKACNVTGPSSFSVPQPLSPSATAR